MNSDYMHKKEYGEPHVLISESELDERIARAVMEERKECAKIASEMCLSNPVISEEWLKSSNDRDEQIAFTHADNIAAAILNRSAQERDRR